MASDWLIAKLSAVMESSGTSAGLEIQRSWVQVLFYSLRDVVLNSPEFNSSPTVRFKIASGFVCCQLVFFFNPVMFIFNIFLYTFVVTGPEIPYWGEWSSKMLMFK